MKLTWFGGTALRVYAGGQIVVVDPDATMEINAQLDRGSSIGVFNGGTLIVDQLRFIQPVDFINMSGDFGLSGVLEIAHLAKLANVLLSSDLLSGDFALTFDFQDGTSTLLHNIQTINPATFHAAQEQNGTFVLAQNLPTLPSGSQLIPVIATSI